VRLLTIRGGLVLGFGVLLVLLILSGLSAFHALSELPVGDQTTLRQFLAKNQQLDEIRAAVYLSGTYIRDYLLEPDRVKAEQSRRALIDANSRIESLLADNGPLSGAGDHQMFEALKREIQDYWQTLEPVDLDRRRRQGYRFLRDEVFPRRSSTLGIAATIQSFNQQQLMQRDHLPACTRRQRSSIPEYPFSGLGLLAYFAPRPRCRPHPPPRPGTAGHTRHPVRVPPFPCGILGIPLR